MAVVQTGIHEGGIILVDKPEGITSFAVVARLRKFSGLRRVGHAGTLDPFATGLLPVCLGRSTRMVPFMEHYDKEYRVTIVFGLATDTQDKTGLPVRETPLGDELRSHLLRTDFAGLRRHAEALTQLTSQIPPMYSAVKIQGRPLYDYARSGKTVERSERPIRVMESVVKSISLQEDLRMVLRIRCSKGTYIRTLADELGRRTGLGAHAAALERLACGPYRLEQAVSLPYLESLAAGRSGQDFLSACTGQGILLPPDTALAGMPRLDVAADIACRLISGQKVTLPAFSPEGMSGTDEARGRLALYSHGCLVAVARPVLLEDNSWQIRTERVLIDLEDFRQRS